MAWLCFGNVRNGIANYSGPDIFWILAPSPSIGALIIRTGVPLKGVYKGYYQGSTIL